MSLAAAAQTAGGLLNAPPGDVLLSVLLEFWLTDAGEPLPPDLPTAAAAAGSSPRASLMQQAAAGVHKQLSGNMAVAAGGAGGWAGGGMMGGAGVGVGAADAVLGSAGLSGAHAGEWGAFVGGNDLARISPVDQMRQAALFGPAAGVAGGVAGAGAAGGGYGGLADRLGLWGGGGGAAMGAAAGGGGGSTLQLYSYQPPSEDLLMVG